jgi:hypothetical protein
MRSRTCASSSGPMRLAKFTSTVVG